MSISTIFSRTRENTGLYAGPLQNAPDAAKRYTKLKVRADVLSIQQSADREAAREAREAWAGHRSKYDIAIANGAPNASDLKVSADAARLAVDELDAKHGAMIAATETVRSAVRACDSLLVNATQQGVKFRDKKVTKPDGDRDDLADELAELLSLPPSEEEAYKAGDDWVERMRKGAPQIYMETDEIPQSRNRYRTVRRLKFVVPTHPLKYVGQNNDERHLAGMLQAGDGIGALAWLFPDEVKARVRSRIKSIYDHLDVAGLNMTKAERRERIAELRAALEQIDYFEMAAAMATPDLAGLRGDADPRAILGIVEAANDE